MEDRPSESSRTIAFEPRIGRRERIVCKDRAAVAQGAVADETITRRVGAAIRNDGAANFSTIGNK